MDTDLTPTEKYPFVVSVRGARPVRARKDGRYFVCQYETCLGLWWGPKDVRVLDRLDH